MNSLRCAIYIRVSTEEQHLNGLSLPAQKKLLTEYALQNGYTIVDYYADEGVSARKPMKVRKELLRLLEDVRQDKIDHILVTKLDRWFRNIKDYHTTEEILRQHNCYWKTILEQYDSSTANGQMIINIMLSVNQAECDRTSERIKAVLDYKRSIGEVTSGRCASYGYRVRNNRLEKDPETAPILEEAYRYYAACFSIRAVVRHLQEEYGSKAPSPSIVERFFRKELYAGLKNGVPGFCEPYLTKEQWDYFHSSSSLKTIPGQSLPYLFSTLIVCPVCGCHYTGYRKKYTAADGSTHCYRRYRCSAKYDRHPAPTLSESALEQSLLASVLDDCPQAAFPLHLHLVSQSGTDKSFSLAKERERLNYLFQKGRIGEDFYEEQYEKLSAELNRSPQNPSTDSNSSPPALSASRSVTLRSLYESLDMLHRQRFWKSILREIHIDPENRSITDLILYAESLPSL